MVNELLDARIRALLTRCASDESVFGHLDPELTAPHEGAYEQLLDVYECQRAVVEHTRRAPLTCWFPESGGGSTFAAALAAAVTDNETVLYMAASQRGAMDFTRIVDELGIDKRRIDVCNEFARVRKRYSLAIVDCNANQRSRSLADVLESLNAQHILIVGTPTADERELLEHYSPPRRRSNEKRARSRSWQ